VGELLAQPQAALLDAPNFSRGSLSGLVNVLSALTARTGRGAAIVEPRLDDFSDWLTLLRDRLELLRPIDRFVLLRRSGLDGNAPQTLVELGEERGVSRERIRQFEARGLKRLSDDWWPSPMRERLRGLLVDGAADLETIAAHPFFAGLDDVVDAFAYVVERLLDEDLRVIELDERQFVARIDQPALDKLMATLRRELANLAFPIPLTMLEAVVERHASRAPGLSRFVRAAIFEDVVTMATEDGTVVAGFGNERPGSILAHLRASATPIFIAELHARFGRGPLPDEALYLGRGVVGLRDHVPDFDRWTQRLIPLCIATMMASDPARQWSTVELRELIAEQARLPARLGPWHLAAMIRVDGRIRYLGRLRVALIHEEAPTDRAYVRDLALDVLRTYGGPMQRGLFIEAVRLRGACSDLTFQLMILNPPFLPTDDDRVGLVERDLPGGAASLPTAVEAIVDVIERTDRALVPMEALRTVHALGGAFATWTSVMISAAIRQSGIAVLNRSGSIGLAGWPPDRLPTRQSTLRELVDQGSGQAAIAAVLDVLHARFGARCTRPTLYNLAQAVGTRLRGDLVIDERLLVALAPQASPDLPDPFDFPGLPAAAVDEFQRACIDPVIDLAQLHRAIDAHVAAYLRRAEHDQRLSPREVEAVARAARSLLQYAEAADSVSALLCAAAVRYFVMRDDAEMDFEVGGLDDDIGVINAIASHLDLPDCAVT
jgi:hypothetical protein